MCRPDDHKGSTMWWPTHNHIDAFLQIQSIVREAPQRPERAVALLVGLAGASIFIGPVLGSVGFAVAIASAAVMSSMAFGGIMLAFGAMMATFFTFGFLSMFGTMFGVFVLPSLIPVLFAGAGAALFVSATRSRRDDFIDVGDDYYDGPANDRKQAEIPRESPAEREARLKAEKQRAEEELRQREVEEELKAFDTLLKSRTRDTTL
eukprot:scaffold98977_cov36-Prasinocladus_malaysianus.AAC.1